MKFRVKDSLQVGTPCKFYRILSKIAMQRVYVNQHIYDFLIISFHVFVAIRFAAFMSDMFLREFSRIHFYGLWRSIFPFFDFLLADKAEI